MLKVEARIESKSSVRYRIVRLISAGRIGSRQFPEVGIIDIQNPWRRGHKRPPRIVHHVNAIDSNLEFLPFGNADTFHEIHVKIGMRGPLDPLATKRADCAGRRIRKDDVAVRIGESSVAERVSERL